MKSIESIVLSACSFVGILGINPGFVCKRLRYKKRYKNFRYKFIENLIGYKNKPFLNHYHQNLIKKKIFSIIELKFEFFVNFHVRKYIFQIFELKFSLKNKYFINYYFIAKFWKSHGTTCLKSVFSAFTRRKNQKTINSFRTWYTLSKK